jgi:uncharacterized protein YcgL (UPF0745 family)
MRKVGNIALKPRFENIWSLFLLQEQTVSLKISVLFAHAQLYKNNINKSRVKNYYLGLHICVKKEKVHNLSYFTKVLHTNACRNVKSYLYLKRGSYSPIPHTLLSIFGYYPKITPHFILVIKSKIIMEIICNLQTISTKDVVT